jgi:hypothetical protein
MQNKAWRVVSIISLLVVVGGSHSHWPSVSGSDEIVYRYLASVDNVETQLLDNGRSLVLEVSGRHGSPCPYLDGYDVSIDADTITVQVWEWRPESDPRVGSCLPIDKPFNTTITIDISELAPGQYDIDVNPNSFNAVSTTITLPNT